ncbi:hypothetical protein H4R21_005971 [Coemansia helicoidea]|uniref:Uncharacterized protein n=2 Tax=Coemansia TaxID=4863 RepID=A0ACC1KPY8_9FUNG|nr:hypothetical protein H4R21_005971 [Coemansia helicoidea]
MHLARSERKARGGTGVIFTMASDFVHQDTIAKESISPPVSAAPMGPIDVTAICGLYSNGEPSQAELHTLHKHSKQTARALGVKHRKVY